MKVGVVCYPTYGGSGVVATELGLGLAEKGHQVHFITYTQPARMNTLNENVFYHEVGIGKYPLFEHPPYVLALSSTLVNVVKFEKLDLLHVHYAIPHAAAAYLAKQILISEGIDIPFVTTLHGTDITLVGKDKSYKPVVEFSMNQSDAVTTVSESLKRETFEFFNIKKSIDVVPNFIDLQKFKKEKKDHFRNAICTNNEKLLIHISNFRKVKRVDDVVRIFEKIRQKMPAKLLMIGDGPERRNVEALCRELGTCEDIRFLGKISEVTEVLSVCDLFLMPSEKESFGLAALEAFACQVPVICSDVGGLPELVEHNVSGMISPVGDVDSMAKDALMILSDQKLHDKFRKEALSRAKAFDIERVLPMYEQIYQSVL